MATDYCSGSDSCSINFINHIAASFLAISFSTGGVDSSRTFTGFIPGEYDADFRGLEAAVEQIKQDVALSERKAQKRHDADAAFKKELLGLVARLTSCPTAIAQAQAQRNNLLYELTGKKLTCEDDSIWSEAAIPLADSGSAHIHRTGFCEMEGSILLSWPVESLFKPCDAELTQDPGNKIQALANLLDRIKPDAVEIVGHSDPRRPSNWVAETADKQSCRQKYPNNYSLSGARAKAFEEQLQDLSSNTLPIKSYPRGDYEAKSDADAGNDVCQRLERPTTLENRRLLDECYKKYRRVDIRVYGGLARYDPKCMSSK
ncbi:MAG: hypothetical protein OEZ06_32920 [Myxococcales bacterium]|nr:hypothetical protein [Myxococcales bacterium]